MMHDPRSATSLLDLEPVKRQQHGCRAGYQARAAYTHTYGINSFGQILKTKGFFNSNVVFSVFDIVNSELHERLNSRHSSTHGSLEYRIERNKLLHSLLYLLKTRKVNDSLRSNANVSQL